MDSRLNSLPPEDEMHKSCCLLLHGQKSSLQKAPAAALDAMSSKRLREETLGSNSLGAVPAFVASDSGEPSQLEEMSKRRKVGGEETCSELHHQEAEPCSMMPSSSDAIAPSVLREGASESDRTAMQQREAKGERTGRDLSCLGEAARHVQKGLVEGATTTCESACEGKEANAGERREVGGQGVCQELMHVLAVDDSPVDRKLVERLLKDVPYRVTTAESGVHALGVLGLDQARMDLHERREGSEKVPPNFDLIMTDYSMPGLNGYQLLQRLKREETGLERVPVVIMSSDNFPNRVAKCIEGGAEDYLHKPVQAADISRIKAQIMNRKGSRSPTSSREEPGVPGSPPQPQELGSKAQ